MKYRVSKPGKISQLATRLLSLSDSASANERNVYTGDEGSDINDQSKVIEIQAQLEKGTYQLNIERLAEKLLRLLGF